MSDYSSRLFDLTGRIYMNLQRSGMAYREYLEGGKTFLLARVLRLYNEQLRQLLLEQGHLLSLHLQKDALTLVSHYDIWMIKWDDLKESLNPASDDVFVFPNASTFPREAAQRFEQEYLRLKEIAF